MTEPAGSARLDFRWNPSPSGLRICVEPIVGESVPGWTARSLAYNVMPAVAVHLHDQGLTAPRLGALMLPTPEQAAALDSILGAPAGTTVKLAGSLRDRPTAASCVINGTAVPSGHCERRLRRFAPASLRASAHHRASWILRTLPICPESWQLLESRCPRCRRSLGWTRAEGISRCEWCRDADGSTVDLRDYAGRPARLDDDEAMAWFCSLFAPGRNAEGACPLVPLSLAGLTHESRYMLMVAMHRLEASLQCDHRAVMPRLRRMSEPSWACADVERSARAVLAWPRSMSELAERAREGSGLRLGSYGIHKELGPILRTSGSEFLPRDVRLLLRQALDRDLAATSCTASGIARFGAQPQHPEYVTADRAAELLGTSRRTLTKLSRSGIPHTVVMTGTSRARRKIPLASLRQVASQLSDMVSGASLARRFGVPTESICVVAEIVGIEPPASELLALRGGRRLFSGTAFGRLEERLMANAKAVEREDWPSFRDACAGFPNAAVAVALGVRAASEGALPCFRSGAEGSWASNLHCDNSSFFVEVRKRWLAHMDAGDRRLPIDTSGACAVLACSPSLLSRIVEAGLLPTPDPRHPRYALKALAAFRRDFCTIGEAAMRLGQAPVSIWRLFESVDRAVSIRLPQKGMILSRVVVRDFLGERQHSGGREPEPTCEVED